MSAEAAKTVLITGASRGIGRATALLCAARGWPVAINYRSDRAAAEATLAEVEARGGRGCVLQGDVAEERDVEALFDAALGHFGGLDAVVVNAGIVAPSLPLARMSAERMTRVINTNVLGALLCARAAARHLARGADAPGASITFVSSVASKLGSPGEYVDYAASKGAIDTLTVGLCKELAPARIRVNAVRPGLIDTEIHGSGGEPDRAHRLAPNVPMARPGTAAEVAEAIVWLTSDAASYVTGALLDVGGGR